MIAGLSSVRDAAITELADVGGAFGNLRQTFGLGGASSPGSSTAGSGFTDLVDFGDTGTGGANSRCLVIGNGVGGPPAEVAAS